MKTLIAFSLVACSFMLAFLIRGSFKISSAEPRAPFEMDRFNLADVTAGSAAELAYIKVPEDLDFAGEAVPWHHRFVRERYAGETRADAYWMVPGLLLEEDRNHLYYECRKILRQEGVPTDFVYLFMAESTLRNRVSHKGAAGVCQFMPEAARTFGLEVNGEVDERYHKTKSIRAACQYLKKSYELLGSWTMAAAAYNHGYNGMLRKKKEHPGKSYFEIPLNAETRRYLYRILCIKEAMRNPTKYGYALKKMPVTQKTFTVTVNEAIPSLSEFAEQHGTDIVELKKHNPWLIWNKL
ncbi:MAG TPA: lytic transglycosylase domain-containing protein, partial [Chitinophagales bacterium]|nr:lytic transglycosylase domain-containing protein [Chitinophagales bacterium]